jgi:hypothetical protein
LISANCSSGLQVLYNLGGDDVWWREVRGIFEGIVFEPEDVEVDLIAVEKPACPLFSAELT